jgi:hypothetical protein
MGGNETGEVSTRHLLCPGCGDRIGVYEPLLRVREGMAAERTSWLALQAEAVGEAGQALWHEPCGHAAGLGAV